MIEKCSICGEYLGVDNFIKYKKDEKHKTYSVSHKECFYKFEELTELIKQIFQVENVPLNIKTQISEFKNIYTLDEIIMVLKYYFIIKNNKPKKNHGIKIIPYIYETAKSYYNNENHNEFLYGIYDIYINNELVYVGKTMRSFEVRFDEHLNEAFFIKDSNNYQQNFLYQSMRDAGIENIKFKKRIICCNKGEYLDLNDKELQCVELGVINALKPKYNYEGNAVPYIFK